MLGVPGTANKIRKRRLLEMRLDGRNPGPKEKTPPKWRGFSMFCSFVKT